MSEQLNWNLFNSIAQDSGYQKKVQQAQAEMEYVTRMEQRSEKRAMEQAKASEQVAAQTDILNEMIQGLENPDVERVKQVELEARQIIQQGVKAAQGNMKQFLLQGGYTKMREYKNAVMGSEELKQGQSNLGIMKQIRDDWSKGKMHTSVNVEVKGKDGKPVMQTMTVQDMIAEYKAGNISSLNYSKAQDTPKLDMFKFRKNYNPERPYESRPVTLNEYVVTAMGQGYDEEIARQHGMNMVSGTDPETGEYIIADAWWGTKDGNSWLGNQGRANRLASNTRGGRGRQWENAAEFISSSTQLDNVEQAIWNGRNVKIGSFNVDQNRLNELYSYFGIDVNRNGTVRGTIKNNIGATSLETGEQFQIDGHAYEVIGLGNAINTVQARGGKGEEDIRQLYATSTIFMTEDEYENMLEENDIGEKHIGGIANPYEHNGEKGWKLDIGLFMNTDRQDVAQAFNQTMQWDFGSYKGGAVTSDYTTQVIGAPQGAMSLEEQQNIYGSVVGTNSAAAMQRRTQGNQIVQDIMRLNPNMPFNEAMKQAEIYMRTKGM